MALRDPRNKSRNNASRRTTSATRSKRAASSAKYNPKPTSSSQRSGKNTGSQRVTNGKGGPATSSRLKQALDGVKTKRTPAKTPPKTTVKTNPASSIPRGAQGPRTAPVQGPSQRVSGLQGSRTKTKPASNPPKSATPKASNVGSQIRQANAVQTANPGRTARATRNAANPGKLGKAAAVAGGLAVAGAILKSSGKPGAAKMSRLGLGGNAPVTKPASNPTPRILPVDKNPIKAPPKKGSTVLAKQGGKEGVLKNGVFYATGWSAAQRNRYQIQLKKNKK